MRCWAPHLAVLLALTLLAGCGPSGVGGGSGFLGLGGGAWRGVNAEKFARAEEHRLRGIALLENSRREDAVREFDELRKLLPAHPLGHVNAAAAMMTLNVPPQDVAAVARRGAELPPRSPRAQLVLAEALNRMGNQQEALQVLERAAAAPDPPIRVLGELLQLLNQLPSGDHSARILELLRRIVDRAPHLLVAQAELLLAQAEAGDLAGATATLQTILGMLPRMPDALAGSAEQAATALQGGGDQAKFAVRQFVNVLKGAFERDPLAAWARSFVELFGNDRDPADLALREWDPAPPALPAPEPAPVTISWRDASEENGLGMEVGTLLAPAATGDVALSRRTAERGAEGAYVPDLVVGGAPARLLLNRDGRLGAVETLPVSGAVAAVDLNNDFASDLYVVADQGDQLLVNTAALNRHTGAVTPPGRARFRLAPAPPARGPGSVLAVDLDQDGDLDLIRVSSAPNQPALRYLRNNGNLTFTDITERAGLQIPSEGARMAVWLDHDADLDPDLFVVRSGGACRLFENRRQDVFTDVSETTGILPDAGAAAAAVLDVNRDGAWDLVVVGSQPHGCVLYRRDGGRYQADRASLAPLNERVPQWVVALDYDNDSWVDLAVATEQGLYLVRNHRGTLEPPVQIHPGTATWVKATDFDRDGDLDLLAVIDGRLRLLANEGASARPSLRITLTGITGTHEPGEGNNSYAIGATVAAVTVWDRQAVPVTEPETIIGLGAAERPLAARVIWPHGVPDNLIAPEPTTAHVYVQIPRSSCPFLYTWDGERWLFHTDVNWRSPLGMRAARGVPIPHNQTLDWVKVPGDRLREVNGELALIVTEELREVAYFDRIQLLAVDRPATHEIYVDERFPFGPPLEFRLYTAGQHRLPRAATNGEGKDLLPALREVDNVFTPVPVGRYRGVAPPHDLILDLGTVPDPASTRLFLRGWLRPPLPSTNIAVSQDGEVDPVPPRLFAGDGRGGWKLVDAGVGLPCGKNKTIVLELGGKLTPGDHRVKLTTSYEIRWDAVWYTSGEPGVPVRRHEVPLASAELRERGYGLHYREVPEGPDLYDYQQLVPASVAAGLQEIQGLFTRLGECAPLLGARDHRLLIMAPGDELRLTFNARALPAPPPGWKRDYVFLSDGWTKDADPNTETGEQVEPLPFHGMKRYPYRQPEAFPDTPELREWRREWNTRRKGVRPPGLILPALQQ